MEKTYWNNFVKSGRVSDYLDYRGIRSYDEVMKNHEETGKKQVLECESGSDSDRYDSVVRSDWRI